MSSGYRLIGFAALASALLIAFGLGAYWTGLPQPTERYQPYQSSDLEQRVVTAAAEVPRSIVQRTPCYTPKSESESGLCAQWRAAKAAEKSADWTMYGVLASAFGIGLLCWPFMLTGKAVKDTSIATLELIKTNKLTLERNIQDNRPFLYIENVEITELKIGPDENWSPNRGENRVIARALVTIKNIGNGISTEALCGMGPGSLYTSAEDSINYHWSPSQSILPKESKIFDIWMTCPYDDAFKNESYQNLFIALCVGYRHLGMNINLSFKEIWHVGREIYCGQMQPIARNGHDDYGDFFVCAQRSFVLDRHDDTRLLVDEAFRGSVS